MVYPPVNIERFDTCHEKKNFYVTASRLVPYKRMDLIIEAFNGMHERERELMSHFLEELVRGSMSEVADKIQRMDVPGTPASLEPKKAASPGGLPVRRLSLIHI